MQPMQVEAVIAAIRATRIIRPATPSGDVGAALGCIALVLSAVALMILS